MGVGCLYFLTLKQFINFLEMESLIFRAWYRFREIRPGKKVYILP